MAAQLGSSFTEFETPNGEPIENLYDGLLTPAAFLERLRVENVLLAWLIRLAGLVLCIIGILCVLGPMQRLVSWIPWVGDLVGVFFFGTAVLLGMIISMVTISISWIAVRPLLAMALLGLSAMAAIVIFKLRRSLAEDAPVLPQ